MVHLKKKKLINVILHLFCSRIFLTVMLFIARGIIAGVFQAAYVYTPEVMKKYYFLVIYKICLE